MRTLRLNDTEYAFCDELGMETVDVRELKLQGCMGCGPVNVAYIMVVNVQLRMICRCCIPKSRNVKSWSSYVGRASGAAVRSASAFWIVWRCLAIRNIP
ncbi:MAG: hypothetical protein ACLRL6_08765 [Clostridium sp.]